MKKIFTNQLLRFFVFIAISILPLVAMFQLMQDARSDRTRSFLENFRWESGVAIDLVKDQTTDQRISTYTFLLKIGDPVTFFKIESFNFLFGTHGKEGLLKEGVLLIGGTDCRFAARSGEKLLNDQFRNFKKVGACDLTKGNGLATLRILVEDVPRLSLWMSKVPSDQSPNHTPFYQDVASPETGAFLVPNGNFDLIASQTVLKRYQLLNYQWGFDLDSSKIFFLLAISWCCMLFGCWILTQQNRRLDRTFLALAIAGFYFGLSFLYVGVIAPFQAPDEPNHFLTFLDMNHLSQLNGSALDLERKAHFERIKFNPSEKFVSSDLEMPNALVWKNHIGVLDMKSRSPITYYSWKVLAIFVQWFDVGNMILAIRTANIILISLVVFGVAFWAWPFCRRGLSDQFYWMALFLPPSLPMFAFHVSNYAFLIASFIIQVGCLIGVLRDTKRINTHILVALAVALLIGAASSRAGLLTLAFWGPVLVVKFLTAENTKYHLEGSIFTRRMKIILAIGFLFLLAPLFVKSQGLIDIEMYRKSVPLPKYVFKVLRATLANFSFAKSDMYLSDFFWYGFGWADLTRDSLWMTWILKLILSVGCILFLVLNQFSYKKILLLGSTLLGLGLYLAVLAAGVYKIPSNLHGRYLLGFYLFLLTISLDAVSSFCRVYSLRLPKLKFAPIAICILALSAHIYALILLNERYFG